MNEKLKPAAALILSAVTLAAIIYCNFINVSGCRLTYISYAAVIAVAFWRYNLSISAAALFSGLLAASAFFLFEKGAADEYIKAALLIITGHAVYYAGRRLNNSKSMASMALANLHAILDSSVQSFLLLDQNRMILAFNKKTEEYFAQYRNRKVFNRTLIEDYIQTDRRDEFVADFKLVLDGGTTAKEWQLTDYKGIVFWIEISMTPAVSEGRVTGVCLSIYDITRRKRYEIELARNEERLTKIIMYSSDIILILNHDSTIQFTGSPAVSNFGWESNDVQGRSLFEFIHPDDAAFVESRFTDAVVNRGITYARDFRVKKRNGEWIRCDAIGNNMLDDPVIEGIIINLRELS